MTREVHQPAAPCQSAAALALAALTLLVSCGEGARRPAAAVATPASEATLGWIRHAAIALRTDDPTSQGGDDLAAFGNAVKAARVIGLGESTHGTHEFFRMKHRILEYLVKHLGFRVFAMEADGAAACAINEYLTTGEGDPARLLHDLGYWIWDTKEILDLLLWLRHYNESAGPNNAVVFRGFDMRSPYSAAARVEAFLRRVDPEAAGVAASSYRCLGPLSEIKKIDQEYPQKAPEEQNACRAGIEGVSQRLLQKRSSYVRLSSPEAYSCALLSAKLMTEAEVVARIPGLRDHYLAENILSLLGPEQSSKAVVWAHNEHVANTRGMGRTLSKRLGAGYVPVGFTFYDGTFRARPMSREGIAAAPTTLTAPGVALDSYEQALHRVGLAALFIDLRRAPWDPSPGAKWLLGPHPLRSVGPAFNPSDPINCCSSSSRAAAEYSLLVFFDHATASIRSSGNALDRPSAGRAVPRRSAG